MELSMEQVINRRGVNSFNFGFGDPLNFDVISMIGKIKGLEDIANDYIRADEENYPSRGLSIMLVSKVQQRRNAEAVIAKLIYGNVWNLVHWEIDAGDITEIVVRSHVWDDYGVKFPVRFATIGNCPYQELAKQYREAFENV